MSRDACEACSAPLIWALSRKEKPAPITREPSEDGNCLIFKAGEEIRYAVLTGDVLEWAREQGIPLRLNHFADCPERDRFRSQ